MRVAVVIVGGVPNPAQNGGTLIVWTVVRHLLGAGHEVRVVALLGAEVAELGASLGERVERLRACGADVRLVRSSAERLFESMGRGLRARSRRALVPSEQELFPHLLDADAVRAAVDEFAADVAYVYHWDGVAATRTLAGSVPRLATVVDPPQLSALHRWWATRPRVTREGLERLLWIQARLRRMPRLMVELLNECEASANFAAHHAAWLRAHGAERCEYLRAPIEDRAGADCLARRGRDRGEARPRVLLIGHLRGISTLEGLDLFARGVLPPLERALGEDAFEVRLVGDYDPPPHLKAALSRPSVSFVGYVKRAEDEFEAADVVLVPTPIRLGTRVRILSAFSFGCPVVAHTANGLGIPELADGDNVLLAGNAAGLADATLRLLADEPLRRRLERRGRETYEQLFAPPVAARALEERLRTLADRKATAARKTSALDGGPARPAQPVG